jgi:hypothetical protein
MTYRNAWLSAVAVIVLLAGCHSRPAPKPPTAPASACGTARPELDAIKSAEGLVIAPDGTIYFSQPFAGPNPTFLGRYAPPYDAGPEVRWLDMGGNALGITLDPRRKVLYAGSRTLKKLLAISLEGTPVVHPLADVEDGINGVTLGADAAVYYSDQTGGHIYRITPKGVKTKVTTSPLSEPNGLAFGPDGGLYVVSWKTPEVTRLELKGGVERARAVFVTLPESRADGIAFDAKGRMYVTARATLHQVSADGKAVTVLGPSLGANIEFGAGALVCGDMYIAGNGKGILRWETDTPGWSVPWHRRSP